MNSKQFPPKLFLRFFRWFCHPDLRDFIEGDLRELYAERYEYTGKRRADLRFIRDVLLLFRPGIIRPFSNLNFLNRQEIFRNNLKIAWRHMLKRKMYSFLNVAGLTSGLAVAILIGLWIYDEVSFNKNFELHDRLAQVKIYQALGDLSGVDISVSEPEAEPFRNTYSADFKAVSLVLHDGEYHTLNTADTHISGLGRWTEEEFPEMFTLNMISGSRQALKDPSTMLISQSLSKALFGNSDPMNKTIQIDDRYDLQVGGIYKDLPENCTFSDTKYLLPWKNKENWRNTVTDWDNHNCALFVQLADHVDIGEVAEKVRRAPSSHFTAWTEEFRLQSLDKIHLYNEYKDGNVSGGRIDYIWMYGIIGIFVLLLACINFMNLATARSEKRAREVGIRKTAGSLRGQLVGQFLTESVLMAFIAFALSIILVFIMLPFFNLIAGKHIVMPWSNTWFWILAVAFTLLTGIISGSYPAFYLSAFKPISVLKGKLITGPGAAVPRKILVVLQFTVSIALIIGTMIVFSQIQYAKDRPAGFNRGGLITVPLNTPLLWNHLETIRNDLLKTGVVGDVAESSQSPADFNNNNTIDWPGKDPASQIWFRDVVVSPDYGKTVGWTILEGRDFSKEHISDSSAAILNKTAADTMNLKDPIGTRITYFGKDYTVIGITYDMVTQSPYRPEEPAAFFMKGYYGCIIIRIKPGDPVHDALATLEPVFKKYNPDSPFEYQFVDEAYGHKFANEERIGKLAGFFASLAIFISCLGIFGLAAFTAECRTKEIGIRKVLGASVTHLWGLLSREFFLLVIISSTIAVPVTLYFMSEWLKNYTYRISLSWNVFALAVAGAVVVTMATVSYQIIRIALANPVKSLRIE